MHAHLHLLQSVHALQEVNLGRASQRLVEGSVVDLRWYSPMSEGARERQEGGLRR